MRDLYEDILRDAYECYLESGWMDEAAYYSQHIVHVRAWCAKWHIRPSPAAQRIEADYTELQPSINASYPRPS